MKGVSTLPLRECGLKMAFSYSDVKKELIEFWSAYCSELDQYVPDEILRSVRHSTPDEVFNNRWNGTLLLEKPADEFSPKPVFVGFLVVTASDDVTYPGCDIHISEAYVVPEHRGKGYMTAALRGLLEQSGAEGVSMIVLNANDKAQRFWERFFSDGWTRERVAANVGGSDDIATGYVFRRTVA